MEEMKNIKWKTPVWKVTDAQAKRILRVSEARALISSVNINDQGLMKKIEASKGDIVVWLQALLFTGMRFAELYKLHGHPELFEANGSIRLDKGIFYDTGKQRQQAKERVVMLSDAGRPIVAKFFATKKPRVILNTTTPEYDIVRVLDAMLKASAERIGLQKRQFSRTIKKPVIGMDGFVKRNEDGSKVTAKTQVPQETTGVMVRTFRSTWESWLVSTRGTDEFTLYRIHNSMGHNRETAMKHYLASQFDEDDIADMLKVTEGFGIVAERQV